MPPIVRRCAWLVEQIKKVPLLFDENTMYATNTAHMKLLILASANLVLKSAAITSVFSNAFSPHCSYTIGAEPTKFCKK